MYLEQSVSRKFVLFTFYSRQCNAKKRGELMLLTMANIKVCCSRSYSYNRAVPGLAYTKQVLTCVAVAWLVQEGHLQ